MSTLFGKQKKTTKRKRSDEDPVVDGGSLLSIPVNNARTNTATTPSNTFSSHDLLRSFDDLGLVEPLVSTCRKLGFRRPTPVQRQLIPFLLHNRREHVLALAATGSGKTAAFVLPIVHHLQSDPYGVYAVIVTPTRELAKQIHQQCLALGSAFGVTSVLVVGGLDAVQQSCALQHKPPHFLVATPGRLAALLRGPPPRPRLQHCRYVVLDEADRLLASSTNCGFERDVAELLLHIRSSGNNDTATQRKESCQTLLFSATMTASLTAMEEIAGGGKRLPLRKFIVQQDGEEEEPEQQHKESAARGNKKVATQRDADDCDKKINNSGETEPDSHNAPETDSVSDADSDDDDDDDKDGVITVGPKIPNSLQQEYVFMPSKVRDAYLLATVRTLMAHGGRSPQDERELQHQQNKLRRGNRSRAKSTTSSSTADEVGKAKSAIIFVSTCERAAFVSGLLEQVGVANVALHSLLSQPRRLAALGKFQSEQVRILVATDGKFVLKQASESGTCVQLYHAQLYYVNLHIANRTRNSCVSWTGHSAHGLGDQC